MKRMFSAVLFRKSEEHMAIDCPHSWSQRSPSQKDAAREAAESLAAQEVVEPPESPEVSAPPMTSPVLDKPEMTSSSSGESDSSISECSQASDAEDPNFMEQDDQIDETKVANVDEAFSDDEGSSSMSPGLTPRTLCKRGRTDDEDTSPELVSKSPRTPSSSSPTQGSGTNNSLEPNAHT